MRLTLPLTFRHRAGVRPYTSFSTLQSPVFLVNSRLGHFTATPSLHIARIPNDEQHPFFRSYGANLPSSFTRVHSRALEFSSRLPVSVCGTVVLCLSLEVFLGSVESVTLRPKRPRTSLLGLTGRICLPGHPTRFNPHFRSRAHLSSCVTPSHHGPVQEY